jgi:hypothetical protein
VIVSFPLAAYPSRIFPIVSLVAIHAGHWKSANRVICVLPVPYVGVAIVRVSVGVLGLTTGVFPVLPVQELRREIQRRIGRRSFIGGEVIKYIEYDVYMASVDIVILGEDPFHVLWYGFSVTENDKSTETNLLSW